MGEPMAMQFGIEIGMTIMKSIAKPGRKILPLEATSHPKKEKM
jgi:hypothetical protein